MPIYEFLCKKCGERFEALVSLGGEKNVSCNACGNKGLEKLISSFGIGGSSNKLKGSASGCDTCSATSCETCK